MTTQPEADRHDPDLSVVMGERRRLINLAYRLLGSLADAEDVVQETYARWYAMSEAEQRAIESPDAWLNKVAGRLCLTVLSSARVRRETYVGEWVPEPLPDPTEWITGRPAADPVDRVTLDESVSMAFLVVLDAMTPAERVAFVLHDVFRYSFAEVADVVGRTPAACRQLASSARRRLRDAHPQTTPAARQARLVRDFKRALASGDVKALVALLDPDVTAIADGGGLVSTTLRPVEGAEGIVRSLLRFQYQLRGLTLVERTVNGQPGLIAQQDGMTVSVYAFEVADDRIKRIWAVRNPEKLRSWTIGVSAPPPPDPAGRRRVSRL